MRFPLNIFLAGLSLANFVIDILAIPVFAISPIADFRFRAFSTVNQEQLEANHRFKMRLNYALIYKIHPIQIIFYTASIWIYGAMCIERYLAICKTSSAKKYFTAKKIFTIYMAIFLPAIGYNFVRFFEHKPGEEYRFESHLRSDYFYVTIYSTFLFSLTHFLIPFAIVIATNVLILRALRSAQSGD